MKRQKLRNETLDCLFINSPNLLILELTSSKRLLSLTMIELFLKSVEHFLSIKKMRKAFFVVTFKTLSYSYRQATF